MKLAIFALVFSIPAIGQITGTVVELGTTNPIEGAIVKIRFSSVSAVTDSAGVFSLDDSAPFSYPLTAAKYGYFNGNVLIFGPPDLINIVIELEAVPTKISPLYPLNQPSDCKACHPEQVAQWEGSPMASTGLNRWVFDVYDGQGNPGSGGLPDGSGTPGGDNGFVYQRDSVHRFASPNSDCSACHSPVHWLADIENNGMGDIHNPNTDMTLGVQCEVCHRAFDVDATKENFPGVKPESFTLLRGKENIEFGLLTDVTYESSFIMRPAYNPQLSAQLCSACHEDNVDVDDDGDFEDPGSVPHETTYSEWRAYRQLVGEANAETCVSCHMPVTADGDFCIFGEGRPQGSVRQHHIRGTSPQFLENAVSLQAVPQLNLGSLTVDVTITNNLTGHAVPTGVVIRNMILLVQARDSGKQLLNLRQGDVVDAIGGVGDPANGYYAGQPGVAFYKNMTDGVNQGIFYTEAVAIASDNRIQPGQSYQGRYVFDLPVSPSSGMVDLDVRLIYRRSFRYLVDQKGWTETGHGDTLTDIQPPHFGHLMEQSATALDFCTDKDLNLSGSIDLTDLHLLNGLWRSAAPFGASTQPTTSIKHFVALVNCR